MLCELFAKRLLSSLGWAQASVNWMVVLAANEDVALGTGDQ
ncbi:hypothetical protein RBSWK_05513 [Rhodopirellula baltica SWK14]|uniref:Uncharacterized protein n=1 Tax=Rhodopirellula baltica SWK14 TaxID=993516 RepID=L7CBU4_RHOBT|nr:hypothetical protein RBSWK_05513 [Rhodopirellula baltica SWK14]